MLFRFHGMAIIHTAKKYIRDELIRKIKRNTLEMKKRENINATLSTIEEAHVCYFIIYINNYIVIKS